MMAVISHYHLSCCHLLKILSHFLHFRESSCWTHSHRWQLKGCPHLRLSGVWKVFMGNLLGNEWYKQVVGTSGYPTVTLHNCEQVMGSVASQDSISGNISLPRDPAVPRCLPKKNKTRVHTNTCTWKFIAALLIMAKKVQTTQISFSRWLSKQNMIYPSK